LFATEQALMGSYESDRADLGGSIEKMGPMTHAPVERPQ
jgi:hypothetical protein